jgi:competence protein ComEA
MILSGVIFGLLSGGIVYLLTRPPRGDAIQLIPPPTQAPAIVHVSGAVVEPGLYTLPAGSRLKDAIDAAGGSLPNANLNMINLAALVIDGEQTWIPYQTQENPETQQPNNSLNIPLQENQSLDTLQDDPILVNINTATLAELESLPGIGPQKAGEIIAYREEHGPFQRIEEIENVSGIGPATFEKLKDLICVSENP